MFSFIPAPPEIPKQKTFTRVTYGQGFRDGLAGNWRGAGLDYCQGYSSGRMRKLASSLETPRKVTIENKITEDEKQC